MQENLCMVPKNTQRSRNSHNNKTHYQHTAVGGRRALFFKLQ